MASQRPREDEQAAVGEFLRILTLYKKSTALMQTLMSQRSETTL